MIEYEGDFQVDIDIRKKENTKYKSFFKMMSHLFHIYSNRNLTPIERKMNKLIESESFLFITQEFRSGYGLNKKQTNQLNERIIEKIKREGGNSLLKVAEQIKLSDTLLFKLSDSIFANPEMKREYSLNGRITSTQKDLEDILKSKMHEYYFNIDFLKYLVDKNKNYLEKIEKPSYFKYQYRGELCPGGISNVKDKIVVKKDNNELKKFLAVTEKTTELLKDISFQNIEQSELVSLIVEYIQSLKEINIKLNNHIKYWSKKNNQFIFDVVYEKERKQLNIENLENSINSIEEKISKLFNKKSNIQINVKEIIKSNEIKSTEKVFNSNLETIKEKLQKSILDVIKEIEKTYSYCVDNKDKLEINKWKDLEKLYNDILPQTLNNYLNVHKEKRDTELSIQEKTSTELLVDSLKSIEEILNQAFTYINSENIKNLSLNNRYINAMKKSF